jgi:hypothetical protein
MLPSQVFGWLPDLEAWDEIQSCMSGGRVQIRGELCEFPALDPTALCSGVILATRPAVAASSASEMLCFYIVHHMSISSE